MVQFLDLPLVVVLTSFDTNHLSAGSTTVNGVFGSQSTSIICQICFHLGHTVVSYPSRYAQTSNVALVGLPTGEHNETT